MKISTMPAKKYFPPLRNVVPSVHFAIVFAAFVVLTGMVVRPSRAATQAKCRLVRIGVLPIAMNGASPEVKGTINSEPITMEIDTGAATTALYQATAEKFNLPMRHFDSLIYGVGGDSEQYLATIKDFTLGSLKTKSMRVPVIREYAAGFAEDGLVGSDFLLHQDVEISIRDQKITFFNPENCGDTFLGYWSDNALVTDLELPDGDQQQYPILNVELNGKKIRALIDTGASQSVVTLRAAARLGITPASLNVTKQGKFGGIGNAKAQAWVASFDSFSIGDETVKHPKILISDLWSGIRHDVKKTYVTEMINKMPEMLIGMDFIRSHRLLFAVSQRHLYFSYLGGSVFYTELKQESEMENKNEKGQQ